MAALVLPLLILAAITGRSSGNWCICKDGVSDTVLQKTLDYACGAGADCNPIHLKGSCFNPDTVKAHCSYAVNSYFQRKGQAQGTCDFSGTATVTTADPSYTGCAFPSSARHHHNTNNYTLIHHTLVREPNQQHPNKHNTIWFDHTYRNIGRSW
ncbi:hypothetical protein ES288_D03G125500v1 [Gossypium darwinii]|uniref:X8 domain-containing protein n=1 Tax=Gossypium darwinii TaxID=34276 RepID=A0A5D2D7T0_GOSDA|nr:hypothetical protein ES288_D03G125500v1 [Gossypium darwinii]